MSPQMLCHFTMLEAVKLNDCGGGESGFGSAKGIFGVIWG
jgi:hypothetical protein